MMKEHEYKARQRYRNDPVYYAIVTNLAKVMTEFKLDPNELHDAVNIAGDMTSQERYYRDIRPQALAEDKGHD